uniref:Glycopolyprotein n=1 Tax=Ferak virus TaxID=1664810 RepID=A0A0H4B814_9VIRU|nr:glycopolyprotein precursor [Ferak virus]
MQLITIVALFSLCAGQYLRDLYSHDSDYGFKDLNKLSSINQKKPEYIYIKPESCTNSKCKVKLSENFNMIVDKGYGVSFKLTHTGLMNTTIDFFMKETNFNITPNYLYTTPMTKIYYRIYFKNYDNKKYDNCVNGVGDEDFTTIADVMLSGKKGKDWDYASRVSKSFDIGPLSTDAIKCGHYWLTTLTTCVEKAIVIRLDRGIATYKLNDEVNLDFTMSALIEDVEHNFRFSGDFNQPQVWQIKDNLALEVNPIGTVISPLRSYMSCLFKTIGEISNTKCYMSNSAPDIGSISNTGIGKFQLTSFNNIDKLLYDKALLSNDFIYPCSEKNYRVAKVKGYANEEFRSKIFEIYNMKKSDHQEDKIVIDFLQNNSSEPNGLMLGDTCCVKVASPTDMFLENAVSSLEDIRETYKQKMLNNLGNIKLSNSGLPRMEDLNFASLMKPTVMVSLLSDGLDIGFDTREYEIKNLKINKMVYFQYAAGSYFTIGFDYVGQPQNIKIESKDINVLTKEVYVHKSGTVEEMVGFKSIGYLKGKPSICVGSNDYCATPNDIDYKQPKDGMIDDNEVDNKEYVDRCKDFFWKLFTSNWPMTAVSVVLTTIEIIFILVIAAMIYKLTRKFFTILCCSAAMKEVNSFITDKLASRKKEVLTQEIGYFNIASNVGTFYSTTYEKSVINEVTKDIDFLTCSSFAQNAIKEVKCESYCTISPFNRKWSMYNQNGTTIFDGKIWSSNAVSHKLDGKTSIVGLIDNLYDNITIKGTSDCVAMWDKAKSGKLSWIKETVMSGYKNKFGYSTIKLVSNIDNSNNYVFEIIDHLTAYDGYDVLEIQKFGKPGQYHAVSVIVVSDGSLDVDDRISDLKNLLSIPNEAIIHSIKNKVGNYIMRSFFLIQCEERCIITDPTSEGKTKEITLTKYKAIIDNEGIKKKTMAKLIDICKKTRELESATEEHMVNEVSVSREGNKSTHFLFNSKSGNFVMPIKHLMNIFDSTCNYKVKFNSLYKNGYHYSNFIIDNDNVYEASRGGPIAINCINTGHGSRCKHLNNEMTAFFNEDGTNDLELKKIKIKGMVYSYAIGDYVEHVSPVTDKCTGKVMVDSLSNAICSHDCCLVSDNYWQKFSLFKANDKYNIRDGAVFSQWKDEKKLTYNLRGTDWCDYSGTIESFKCVWKEHKAEMIIFLCMPFIIIALYYSMLVVYHSLVWCFSKNPKRDSRYMKTKRYKKEWFFSNMANNLMSGRPKFWQYEGIPLEDMDRENGIGKSPAYRRRVKPVM